MSALREPAQLQYGAVEIGPAAEFNLTKRLSYKVPRALFGVGQRTNPSNPGRRPGLLSTGAFSAGKPAAISL